jgi:glycine dehydrogenase subunit 1
VGRSPGYAHDALWSPLYPTSFLALQPPGSLGADIVVGEGQSFGNAVSFGGPYIGFFASKENFLRAMPGRLVGETVDLEGRRGFILAVATREQHIRREKATSNICTNQALCALAVLSTWPSWKRAFESLAEISLSKCEYAKKAGGDIRSGFRSLLMNSFFAKGDGSGQKLSAQGRSRASPEAVSTGMKNEI